MALKLSFFMAVTLHVAWCSVYRVLPHSPSIIYRVPCAVWCLGLCHHEHSKTEGARAAAAAAAAAADGGGAYFIPLSVLPVCFVYPPADG